MQAWHGQGGAMEGMWPSAGLGESGKEVSHGLQKDEWEKAGENQLDMGEQGMAGSPGLDKGSSGSRVSMG